MTEPSQPPWVAETHFSGVIAEMRLPHELIAPRLPAALRLAPALRRAHTVPVILVFGEHADSAVHMGAMQVRTGVRFREVLFGVPCVFGASFAPVLFVTLMYCDEPVSTWTGNALYGFNKRPARMEWCGASFVVTDDRSDLLLQASTEVVRGAVTGHCRLFPLASLPIVGRRHDGSYVMSQFAWQWRRALIESVRIRLTIEDPALSPGGPTRAIAPPRSAVCVRSLRWRISWPEVCHGVDGDGHRESRRVTARSSSRYAFGLHGGRTS